MVRESSNIILRLHSDIEKYLEELEEKTKRRLKKMKIDKGEDNQELKNLLIVFISLQELMQTLELLTSSESNSIKQKIKRAEDLINFHLVVNKKREKRKLASSLISEKVFLKKEDI